jgi:hypothetical protein
VSVQRSGVVDVGTVVFRRATVTGVAVGSPAVVDGVTVASLDAGGVLSYMPHLVSEVAITGPVTLRGIRALHANGDPYEAAYTDELSKHLLMLRAQDGTAIQVVHEDLTVLEPTERITTAYGLPATVGPDAVQVFWSVNGANRRWRCPLWSVYLPASPAHWDGAPTSTAEALDRLAAAVSSGGASPIP